MTALPSTEALARLAAISAKLRSQDPIPSRSEIAAEIDAIREALDRREAEDWWPETNILPWVALTIEQMRRFEASSGDLERLGLNGEWIPTDTPLSPGLVYRIKPNPTTEASHGE